MSRVIFLVSFLALVALVISLKSYQGFPLNNDRFDETKAKQSFNEYQKLVKGENPVGPEGAAQGPSQDLQAAVERGKKIFHETGQCITCHGEQGQGNLEKKAPKVAGQFAWYVETQLKSFQKKERINVDMEPYLEKLTPQDFSDVAKYLASEPWP